MKKHTARETLVDVLAGGLIGGLVGAVVAVNFVLVVGVDQGYEASLGEVFAHSPIVGVVTLLILVAGPILGFLAARRSRALNESTGSSEPRKDHALR